MRQRIQLRDNAGQEQDAAQFQGQGGGLLPHLPAAILGIGDGLRHEDFALVFGGGQGKEVGETGAVSENLLVL